MPSTGRRRTRTAEDTAGPQRKRTSKHARSSERPGDQPSAEWALRFRCRTGTAPERSRTRIPRHHRREQSRGTFERSRGAGSRSRQPQPPCPEGTRAPTPRRSACVAGGTLPHGRSGTTTAPKDPPPAPARPVADLPGAATAEAPVGWHPAESPTRPEPGSRSAPRSEVGVELGSGSAVPKKRTLHRNPRRRDAPLPARPPPRELRSFQREHHPSPRWAALPQTLTSRSSAQPR